MFCFSVFWFLRGIGVKFGIFFFVCVDDVDKIVIVIWYLSLDICLRYCKLDILVWIFVKDNII